MLNNLFIALIIPLIILSGCSNKPITNTTGDVTIIETNETKKAIAVKIADYAKELPTFNLSNINNAETATDFVNNANRIIDIINENFNADFSHIDISELSDIAKFVEKYSPLVAPYNELVYSSKNLNPNDDHSINEIYINSFYLAFDVVLIQGSIAHNIVFKGVGILNNELKLAKIREFCGNSCHGLLLSKIYQFSKGLVLLP